MKPLILAAIVLALLWRSRRKPAPLFVWRESDDGVLPVDPYTWTMA